MADNGGNWWCFEWKEFIGIYTILCKIEFYTFIRQINYLFKYCAFQFHHWCMFSSKETPRKYIRTINLTFWNKGKLSRDWYPIWQMKKCCSWFRHNCTLQSMMSEQKNRFICCFTSHQNIIYTRIMSSNKTMNKWRRHESNRIKHWIASEWLSEFTRRYSRHIIFDCK
jgi:hypothetical protein